MSIGYGEEGYGEFGYGGTTVTQTASLTVTLSEEGELTVQVNDESGTGISSANVSIENSDASVTDSGTTDTNGQIIFSPIPIDDYTVTVTKTGFFDETATVAAGDFT